MFVSGLVFLVIQCYQILYNETNLCFMFCIYQNVVFKIIISSKNKKKRKRKLKQGTKTQKTLLINGLESEICLNYPYKAILKTRVAGFQLISCTSGIAPAVQNDSCLRVA